jgi:Asp-tRNA(Asn)/Glu-tRNA(Gln) amidotransferase A subunit family amidase
MPASATAIVGLRPTYNLVHKDGVLPLEEYRDTLGPMCRSVTDLAATLEAQLFFCLYCSEYKEQVIVDPQYASQGPQNYRDFVDSDGLRGERIGLAVELLEYEHTDGEVSSLFG